jgi:hypothetical protein
MTLAITHAANTTVPVRWTTSTGHTATAQMPTLLHASYAAEQHTTTVVQLADTPQVTPAVAPASTSGAIGLSGATLLGLGIVVWIAAKWKQRAPEVKRAFILGAVATVLVGSWGLFGTLTNTVRTTGDSTGSVIGTVGQQTTYGR